LKRVEAFGFSGALIVEKDGKIILSKGYGWADRAKNVKNTPTRRFCLLPFPNNSPPPRFFSSKNREIKDKPRNRQYFKRRSGLIKVR
jgi:hypothetical protein